MEPRLPNGAPQLTDRQREVAHLVAAGLTNAEIGERLGISLDGAKYHVSEVLSRLSPERREQIGEWVRAQAPPSRRRLRMLVGIAAALLAVVVVAIIAGGRGDDPRLSAANPTDGPGAPVEESPPPTSTPEQELGGASAPDPPAPPESLYQPVAWDHPRLVNRTPPSSLDEAIKERAVHTNGWRFEGEPPDAFDLDGADDEVCPSVPAGGGQVQSGDWVLVSAATGSDGQQLPEGHRYFSLIPIDPEVDDGLDLVRQTVRIRAIDATDWATTHLTEWHGPLSASGPGDLAFQFVFESPQDLRWLAIVTRGPLWGCFTIEIGGDPIRWAAGGLGPDQFPQPPAGLVGGEVDLAGYTTFDGEVAGSAERICVDLGQTLRRVRSGQFGLAPDSGLGNGARLADGARPYSPFMPGSKVGWLPEYYDGLGDFTLRAVRASSGVDSVPEQAGHTYIFSTPYLVRTEVISGPRPMFITSPVLPRPGTWTMVATALPYNWGCFVSAAEM